VPDQTYRTIHVELTQKQKDRIADMALEYPDPIVRIGKVHQIENGVLAGDEFNDPESFENGKVDKIVEFSEEFPRMIVFAKYTNQISQIAGALREKGRKVFILDGKTKDKGSILEEAKSCKEYVFIAQAQVSAGWELPECPVMVFASRTYSWVDYDQGIGRIQRANNIKKNLYIHLVVKGGTDEAVHECLENKKDFNERIYAGV
jgi:superfamily II DNA or RNA helicase